ncbi:C-terminal, D2-small domain, of ClpB family protein [Leishmania donovani]|nr:C-terminal, D2-small domain, of ClpB family protein [Leishmania donovani]
MEQVRQRLAPEFINRLDDIIMFNRLSREDIRSIVEILFAQVQKMLTEHNITLEESTEVYDWLSVNGYSAVYGARPLKRLVQSELLNQLALMLLDGRIREGELVRLSVQDGHVVVVANHALSPEKGPTDARLLDQ